MDIVREEELAWIKKQFWAFSLQIFTMWMTPVLIITAVFGMYLLLDNQLTAETAFTMVSTVFIIQVPNYYSEDPVVNCMNRDPYVSCL